MALPKPVSFVFMSILCSMFHVPCSILYTHTTPLYAVSSIQLHVCCSVCFTLDSIQFSWWRMAENRGFMPGCSIELPKGVRMDPPPSTPPSIHPSTSLLLWFPFCRRFPWPKVGQWVMIQWVETECYCCRRVQFSWVYKIRLCLLKFPSILSFYFYFFFLFISLSFSISPLVFLLLSILRLCFVCLF